MSSLSNNRPIESIVRRRVPDIQRQGIQSQLVAPGVVAAPPSTVAATAISQAFDILNGAGRVASQVIDLQTGADSIALSNERFELGRRREQDQRAEEARREQQRRDNETRDLALGSGRRAAIEQMPAFLRGFDSVQISSLEDIGPVVQTAIDARVPLKSPDGFSEGFGDALRQGAVTYLAGRFTQDEQAQRDEDVRDYQVRLLDPSSDVGVTLAEAKTRTKLSDSELFGSVVIPAARAAASQGSKELSRFDPLLADKVYTQERWILEKTAADADYQRDSRLATIMDRERVVLEREEGRAIEQRRATLEGFDDAIALKLSRARTMEDARSIESFVTDAIEKNPDFAGELLPRLNSVRGELETFANNQMRQLGEQSLDTRANSLRGELSAIVASGNGYSLSSITEPIVLSEQLPNGEVVTRSISPSEARTQAVNGAMESIATDWYTELRVGSPNAPEAEVIAEARRRALPEQIKAAAGLDSAKYQPWESLLLAGANADSIVFNKDGLPQVPERSIQAVRQYASMKAVSPEIAAKYAGPGGDFYEGVLEQMKEPGIGNDVTKAIGEHVRISRMPKAYVQPLKPEDLKSMAEEIEGVTDENAHLVTPGLNSRYERYVRMGMSPDKARSRAVEIEKTRAVEINGSIMRPESRVLPPGVYGSFKKTAEAAIDLMKQRFPNARAGTDPVDWSKVSMAMDPATGKITLLSELLQPLDIPLDDQPQSVQDILSLGRRAKLDGVMQRSNRPREMTKAGSIPWSAVPGKAFTEWMPNAAKWWDERVAKPSTGK